MTTNNATRIDAIKSAMRSLITDENKTQVAIVPEETLAQVKRISETFITHFGFDELKMTEEELDIAVELAKELNQIPTVEEVVDGVVVPWPAEKLDMFIAKTIAEVTIVKTHASSVPNLGAAILVTSVLCDLLHEVKQVRY